MNHSKTFWIKLTGWLMMAQVLAAQSEPISDHLQKVETWATGTVANIVVVLAIFALGVRYVIKSRGHDHASIGATAFGCICILFARGLAAFFI